MLIVSGHSITPIRFVSEDSLRITLKQLESTAELTPQDMYGITINSWMMSEDGAPAAGTVWRVRSIRTEYHTGVSTVSLEHIINVLRNSVIVGEVTPATITGNAGATTCTAKQAVQYILGRQSDWTLGRWASAYGGHQDEYKFENTDCYDALMAVVDTLDACWLALDTTHYPFVINFDQLDPQEDFSCELRFARNMRTLSYEVNRSGMYTRFYPVGKDGMLMTGRYVAFNEDVYGTIGHVERDDNRDTDSALEEMAAAGLRKNSEPQRRLTASVVIPHGSTETLDQPKLGKVCRVCTQTETFLERIVQVDWQDAKRQPDAVNLTLGSENVDAGKIIAHNWKRTTTRI